MNNNPWIVLLQIILILGGIAFGIYGIWEYWKDIKANKKKRKVEDLKEINVGNLIFISGVSVKVYHRGIRFLGKLYHNPELINYAGEEVTIRFDDVDNIKVLYVFGSDRKFICKAEESKLIKPRGGK